MFGKIKIPATRRFLHDENGAVTVDWVVLIVMVIALCMASVLAMSNAADSITGRTSSDMTEKEIEL